MKRYKHRKTFTFEGKRYNAYGDTEREALQKMIQKKADLESGKVTVSSTMSVREWTEIALATYKANLKDTYCVRMRIQKHIFPKIGSSQLKSVKPVQCQDILNSQSGKSFSLLTKLDQDLHFIFSTAKQNGLITSNPAEYIVKPRYTKGKRQSLSADERAAFIAACEDTDKFMVFELMLYCGCRASEAMCCKGGDISVDDGIAMLHIRGTKTANADRYVPMPHSLYDRLKDVPTDAPLAPSWRGTFHTRSSYTSVTKTLYRAMNIAMGCKTFHNGLVPPYPLRESFVPYELRHTYCSDLARRGIDIRVAQKLMGHSTIAITSDIYTHVDNEHILDEAKRILGE